MFPWPGPGARLDPKPGAPGPGAPIPGALMPGAPMPGAPMPEAPMPGAPKPGATGPEGSGAPQAAEATGFGGGGAPQPEVEELPAPPEGGGPHPEVPLATEVSPPAPPLRPIRGTPQPERFEYLKTYQKLCIYFSVDIQVLTLKIHPQGILRKPFKIKITSHKQGCKNFKCLSKQVC